MLAVKKIAVQNAIFAPKPIFSPKLIDHYGLLLLKLREICWTPFQN